MFWFHIKLKYILKSLIVTNGGEGWGGEEQHPELAQPDGGHPEAGAPHPPRQHPPPGSHPLHPQQDSLQLSGLQSDKFKNAVNVQSHETGTQLEQGLRCIMTFLQLAKLVECLQGTSNRMCCILIKSCFVENSGIAIMSIIIFTIFILY